ncbi:hypothetical protein [Brasilonema sp. UFV-L1]|uniref:hypothetical protein n=1 Tax=Brasilonema sp. UFV-L1 TaxID=2234130 RepID=UPI00145D6ADD|nr:hypothetical protein [Brasilonema sp. UFV-L1]
MWEKLIELIYDALKSSFEPRKQLAKAMTRLYTTMYSCQEAYTQYNQEPTDQNFRVWATEIDNLVITLQRVQHTLKIFHPRVLDRLNHYAQDEARLAYISRPNKDLVKHGISTLKWLVKFETGSVLYQNTTDFNEDMADFDKALEQLSNLIQAEFKMDEIF